jgi:polysaccharide export outer membrane protein
LEEATGPAYPADSASAEEYTVQPEDVLQLTVYEEPDLTTKTRVTSSGEVTFPLLGRVAVAGLTVPQVQEKLTRLLAEDYLVNPQVQVFIDSYRPRYVFVTGAVNKPGSYSLPIERPTTVMEAITMAGGFADEASLNGTRIIRIDHGQEKTIQVKVNDIIKKGNKTEDVVVWPSDIIFVPESFF